MTNAGFPNIPILYQEEEFAVVNKPSGMLCHRGPECRDSREFYLLQILREILNQHIYLVHRIDRGTSGIMVVAFSKGIAAKLSNQFENQQVDKIYLAIVRGWIQKFIWVDGPLNVTRYKKNKSGEMKSITQLKDAFTLFTSLSQSELPIPMSGFPTSRYSLVQAKPFTGRHHQIRRHLNIISHPVLGDHIHGDRNYNSMLSEKFGCHRLLLHAYQVTFVHPTTREKLIITAPLPQDFCYALSCLQLKIPDTIFTEIPIFAFSSQ